MSYGKKQSIVNNAKPPAQGFLIGCNMNTNIKGLMKNGFGFLDNIGEHGGGTSTITDAVLLRHLAPLRKSRVWLPGEAPVHATNLRIYRVRATGGVGAVVEFRAGK